ncbi:MAG: DNA sulfur modification protein DndB [Thaumarchaeota archaeon]|nr:DNA sulfur modification protein DndB [Nitrososphaerota archaeon]
MYFQCPPHRVAQSLADELETGAEVYGFDAIRGVQAGRPFYVAMCPLKIIPKLFLFNDHELPPMLRAQRTLRKSRIPAIANYIINNPKDYIFSSLTASIDGKIRFSPAPSLGQEGKLGRLYISMNARMLINDGQHRRAAIEEALKRQPLLGNESISVVFFQDKGLKRSQQMFSDLNKHATKPTKSLSILYDHRDSFARFIVKLVNSVEIFKGRTELEKTSISNRASEFFTLNGISEATKYLLKLKSKDVPEEQQQIAHEFWDEVSKNIPEWKNLVDEQVTAGELRKNYVNSHTNLLNALGMVGHILITYYPDWKKYLKKLQKIDWSRNSSLWAGKIVLDGRMMKQKIGIKKAADVILHECGITKTLDDFESQ